MNDDLARPERSAANIRVDAGLSFDWTEPGRGVFTPDVVHAFVSREVHSIAGATQFDDLGLGALWRRMRHASAAVVSAALLPGCEALEIRYRAEPGSDSRTRLRMLLTAWTSSTYPQAAINALDTACAALPDGFRWTVPPESEISQADGLPVLELRRREAISEPTWNYVVEEARRRVLLRDQRPSGRRIGLAVVLRPARAGRRACRDQHPLSSHGPAPPRTAGRGASHQHARPSGRGP